MKIPQYFLPECINTEDTQVCRSALVHNCSINHRFKEYLKVLQATIHSQLVNLPFFAFITNSDGFRQCAASVLFLRLCPAWWPRWPQLWSSTPTLLSWRLQLEPSSPSVRRGQRGALWPRLPGTRSSGVGWTTWRYCWMTRLWWVYQIKDQLTHLHRKKGLFKIALNKESTHFDEVKAPG